jgi:hypothetical protein
VIGLCAADLNGASGAVVPIVAVHGAQVPWDKVVSLQG